MTEESSWRVHRCPRCHEAFRRREHLVLHTGRRHGGDMGPDEAGAFAAALAREEEQLAWLRVHVRAGFAVLPIFLFLMFSVILVTETGSSAGILIAGVPGFVVFGALVYAMVVSRAQYERVEAERRAQAERARAGKESEEEVGDGGPLR